MMSKLIQPCLALLLAPASLTFAQTFTRIDTGTIVNDGGASVGSSWGDYDNDGDQDLFVANDFGENNFFYENNGNGTFTRITSGAFVNDGGYSQGSSWGDYDNDGDLDLFVANWDGENFLYANNGDGVFNRIATGAIVNNFSSSSVSSWGDYDNDGDLDLFVANEVGKNFLYANNGDGTFTRITTGDIVNDGGDSRGCSWGDYDNDGDLDLFVADFDENNFLYANNGDGTFTRITTGAIVNDDGYSHGSSWGDYDNDGDLDLFVADDDENNFLYTNNGDGTFTRVTAGAIVNDDGDSQSSSWGDYDNDGDLDLFVANLGDNFLYANNGDGTFTRIITGAIVNDGGDSYGCSWCDYDNDGDLDLFVANDGENNFLYANNGNSHKWIKISCRGTFSNSSAIGARIKVKAIINGSPVWQVREISGQTGFGGQNSLTAAFGLGDATVIDSIKVEWPSGFIWDSTNVEVNQSIDVVEQPVTRVTTGAIVNDVGNSHGSSWGDYDNDGDLDLFVANYVENNFLYENNGDGAFTRVTTGAIVNDDGISTGSSWGDYDNDDDLDLFVTNDGGQDNFLYENNGDGAFTRITIGGIVNDWGFSSGSSWGDYDNDGDLDLFVANDGENNFLYENNGDGTFTRIITGAIVNDGGYSQGSSWGDYDNDGDLDLFVANDDENNFLYENNGDGTFTRITTGAIVNDGGFSSGSSWGDYDNDGDLDLFVADSRQNNFLYANNGDGTFTRVVTGAIVNNGGSQGSSWGDYDNDGDLDLFVANVGQNNFLYANNGDGTFTRIIAGAMVNDGGDSQSGSWGDYDNDGDLDLFVANSNDFFDDIEENNFLYENNGFDNNWINIRCVGRISNVATGSNRSGIGAKVRLKAISRGKSFWQLREISGQTGHGGQNSLDAEFGLGDASMIDSVKIEWPSGTNQVLTNIQANQFLTIPEIQPLVAQHTPLSSAEADSEILVVATITGNLISEVSLNYRQGGETRFTSVTMSDQGNGSFQGNIQSGKVTPNGLEYNIVATDIHGNKVQLPSKGNYHVQVHVREPGISRGQPQPNGSEQIAYRLFSVPLKLDNKSAAAVLEDDLGKYDKRKWRFFELIINQTYLEFPNTSGMASGKGFWIITKEPGKVIDSGAGISNRTSEEFPVVLHPKWNFVGNPFDFPIPVENIRLKSGNALSLRAFTGNWNDPITNAIARILPFEGYAVSNSLSVPDTLLINPDPSFSVSALVKREAASPDDHIKWSVRILAQCQDARDIDNVIAVAPAALKSWDKQDLPEPPVIGEYVSVYFPHRDWKTLAKTYCVDARPEPTDGEVWEFEVKTNIRDKVKLIFEGIGEVPKELEVWLVDDALKITQNLREQGQYAVAGAGTDHPKLLKLVVGKRDFVDQKLAETRAIPTTYELSQNFPNPFNPATTIRYGLPKAERVTLKIYNLLGAEVATLVDDEQKPAGYHSAIWDGRDKNGRVVASGVYVYRMRAGDFAITKKMVLVR